MGIEVVEISLITIFLNFVWVIMSLKVGPMPWSVNCGVGDTTAKWWPMICKMISGRSLNQYRFAMIFLLMQFIKPSSYNYSSGVTWASWHFRSLATQMMVPQLDQGWGAVSDLSLISDLSQKFKHDLWRAKSKLKLSQKQHLTPG